MVKNVQVNPVYTNSWIPSNQCYLYRDRLKMPILSLNAAALQKSMKS